MAIIYFNVYHIIMNTAEQQQQQQQMATRTRDNGKNCVDDRLLYCYAHKMGMLLL